MDPLIVVAILAVVAVALGSWASYKLGSKSRKKEDSYNLDEPEYFIQLGQRVTPPSEEVDPRWRRRCRRAGRMESSSRNL